MLWQHLRERLGIAETMNSISSHSTSTLVLSDQLISQIITLKQTTLLVEAAFAANAMSCAVALPVVVESLDGFDIHFGVKSGYLRLFDSSLSELPFIKYLSDEVGDVIGLKAGGYWFRNPAVGLPGHRAALLLFDPETGNVTALMSANTITCLRTAAVGAIAAKYLARQDSHMAGIIGAGEQAHAQLEAVRLSRPISHAYVWDKRPAAAYAYASTWKKNGMCIEAVPEIRVAVENADVVITATPSTEVLVRSEWVRQGTHVTAVGSDGYGKQELDIRLLQRAKLVVDKVSQSLEIGELQHATRQGLDARKMIHAELGEICAGQKPGRQNDQEITVFDSSGVSFQDLVVAGYLVRQAKSKDLGEYVKL